MTVQAETDASSEWRTGWRLALAGSVGFFVSVIYIYTLGVVTPVVEREFGWSRTEITSGLSIVSLLSVILSPVVGLYIDRLGPRPISLVGVAIHCSALAALGFTGPSIWTWLTTWTVLAFGVLLTSSTVWTAVVAGHFERHRGLAIAVVLCGASLSGAIVPTMANLLIEAYSWRTAYFTLGGCGAAVTLPLLYICVRDQPRRIPRSKGIKYAAALLPGLGL